MAQQEGFDQTFALQVAKVIGETNASVVHFEQQACECNQVAEAHIESVELLASRNGYVNSNITLTEQSELSSIIPATPAIAVFDNAGSLVYIGPYSAGYACTVGNGLVESYLSRSAGNLIGATVLSETKGCYCPL